MSGLILPRPRWYDWRPMLVGHLQLVSGHLSKTSGDHLAYCEAGCQITANYNSFPADEDIDSTFCGYSTQIQREGRESLNHITYHTCDGGSPCALTTSAYELYLGEIRLYFGQTRSGTLHSCENIYDAYEILKYTGSPVGITDGWPYMELRETSRTVTGDGTIFVDSCFFATGCSSGDTRLAGPTSCSSGSFAVGGDFGGGTLTWTKTS